MKIKITTLVPVKQENRPILGEIYEVVRTKITDGRLKVFFVNVNGTDVGVYEERECEVVEE